MFKFFTNSASRKLRDIVLFARYSGETPHIFIQSTPVAIFTITQQKRIVFTNADTVYPSLDC